ncbi:MAG: class I SAM-dependent methyltransferase [Spirochaetaceae bacterium]|nr:class I SAM-dependent methyltransferase [Spirochaetaceae bacterium]
MDTIQNIVEYYEELFPITEEQRSFFDDLIKIYPFPAKYLRLGCGTGQYEHQLAKTGIDVTGLETSRELLDSANRRRRTQLMSIRFFQMNVLEMTRFLGKGFYHIISCLESRILFVHDYTLMRKFFYDCRQLLSEGGSLVISLVNFNKLQPAPVIRLPPRSSIRAKMFTDIITADSGDVFMNLTVENSTGKLLPVLERERIYPLIKEEIEDFAREAGFTHFAFFSDFAKNPFTDDSQNLVCVIS